MKRGECPMSKRFFCMTVLYWIALLTCFPYQTIFLSQQGTSLMWIGIVTGAYGLAQMLLRIPLGIHADRSGRAYIYLLIGASACLLTSLFFLLLPNALGFLLANLVAGIGSAIWICLIVTYTRLRSEAGELKALAEISFANQLGILLGFSMSVLLYTWLGMRALATVSLVAALGVFYYVLRWGSAFAQASQVGLLKKGRAQASLAQIRATLRHKRLWAYSVFAFFQVGVTVASAQSFSTEHAKALGASAIQVGLMNVSFILGAVSFAFLMTRARLSKLGTKVWTSLGLFLMAIYLLLVPTIQNVTLLLLMQVLTAVFAGAMPAFTTHEAMAEVEAETQNTAIGVYQAVVGLGITVLPPLTGLLYQRLNFRWSYAVLALLCLMAIGYLFWLEKRLKKCGEVNELS